MSEQSREKHWQLKAGRMASIANWALVELLNTIHGDGEQMVPLEPGDWVIPELDGKHFYPCKPEIFAVTYEQVRE